MDEVKVDARDRDREMREPVQQAFLRPPVETLAPVAGQLLQVAEVCSRNPGRYVRGLVRPARASEPLAQIDEHLIWHVNGERLWSHPTIMASAHRPGGGAWLP